MLEQLANEEVERVFLSSLINGTTIYEVSEIVQDKHFYQEAHRDIYTAIKTLDSQDSIVNAVMVATQLSKINQDHIPMLKMVLAQVPQADIKLLAVELIESFNKRELYKLTISIQTSLNEFKNSAVISKEIEDLSLTLDVGVGSRAKSYDEWEKYYDQLPPLPKYSTGVSFIDEALGGGVEAGQLILVMGDAEAGKTLMTTQILRNVSNGFKTLFFCFEFTVRQFVIQNAQKKRNFTKENMQIINDGYSLSDVEREIKIWAKKGCRFVVIDSQMRVDNSTKTGTVEQSESEKFSKLAKLCHRLEIVILFIAQQGKEDTRGGTHNPMGSKKGAHEANQIWYIHKLKPKYDQNGNDENKEVRELEISKNKQNGRHFKTEIRLNPAVLEFFRKYKKEGSVQNSVSA